MCTYQTDTKGKRIWMKWFQVQGILCNPQASGPLMRSSHLSLLQPYSLYRCWFRLVRKIVWWILIFSWMFLYLQGYMHSSILYRDVMHKEHFFPQGKSIRLICQCHLLVWSKYVLTPCADCSQKQKKKEELRYFQRELVKQIYLTCPKDLDNIWKRS